VYEVFPRQKYNMIHERTILVRSQFWHLILLGGGGKDEEGPSCVKDPLFREGKIGAETTSHTTTVQLCSALGLTLTQISHKRADHQAQAVRLLLGKSNAKEQLSDLLCEKDSMQVVHT
jgi:hypothetical protein